MAHEATPPDLLAHWVYRRDSLWRDLHEAKSTLDRMNRDIFMKETFPKDIRDIRNEIEVLTWLQAEAEYTTILLEVRVRVDALYAIRGAELI